MAMESVEAIVFSFLACFVLGALSVVVYVSWTQANQLLSRPVFPPVWPHTGLGKAAKLALELPQLPKRDQRITGSGNIDEQLHKLTSLVMRDYVEKWYYQHISPDQTFLHEVYRSIHLVLVEVAQRSKEADLYHFIIHTLPEDVTQHLKLYKQAQALATGGGGEVESEFFKLDPEDDPWMKVCCCEKSRRAYLRQMTELLLFLLLPKEDFSCPPLKEFLTDILVEQVWLPLLRTLLQPDYLNSTVLMLCKDSALTGDSFMASVNEGGEGVEAIEGRLLEEIQLRKSCGLTAEDQQRVSVLEGTLEEVRKARRGMKTQAEPTATEPIEIGEEEDSATNQLTLSATIPSYTIREEGGGKHAFYQISVKCEHSNIPVVEEWTTLRRYSDFHDLHLSLKSMLPNLPPNLSLPVQLSFSRLDSALLESRRLGLQAYLQALLVPSFLATHPQLMKMVPLFLTEGSYRHTGKELRRRVDAFVQPFLRGPLGSSKSSSAASSPVTSHRQPFKGSLSGSKGTQDASFPPAIRKQRSSTFSLGDERTTSEESEEESVPVSVVSEVLDEVFDLREQSQWLRRQLTTLLNQLLGEKINRKIVEKLDWLVSPEQISEYLRSLSQSLWPGGYPASPAGPPYERSVACRSVLARAKLIGSIPDELRRFIGSERTTRGMSRVFAMYQSEALNRRLALKLLEGALDTIFTGRNLRETLRKTRIKISEES